MGTDRTKDLILQASSRVFPRLGYHRATVEDILQEAGVARSTFYSYFSGKRDVFNEIISNITDTALLMIGGGIDEIVERFGGAPGEQKPDEELTRVLIDLMGRVFRFIQDNKGMTRIFLNDLVAIDEEMTRMFHDFQDRFTSDFERLMRFGLQAGLLREVDAHRAADFIVGGLVHTARNISAGIDDCALDDLSEQIVDMQLNGLVKSRVRVA